MNNVVLGFNFDNSVIGNRSSANVVSIRPYNVTSGTSLLWFSDFRYTTGSSRDALRDGPVGNRKWTLDSNAGLTVITSSAGIDFPSNNVLEVRWMTSSVGYNQVAVDSYPTMSIGQSRHWRFVCSAEWPSQSYADPAVHPIESYGAFIWGLDINTNVVGTGDQWKPYLTTGNGFGAAFPNGQWYFPFLNKSTPYTFEIKATRGGTSTFWLDARVWSGSTLLYTSDDLLNDLSNKTLTQFNLSGSSSGSFTAPNEAQFNSAANGWYGGSNGMGGGDWVNNTLYMYQGCFAVSDTNWCGLYNQNIG